MSSEDKIGDTMSESKSRITDTNDDIPMTFPQRLMDLLSNEEHVDIITWLPHGKAFIIYKKKKFAAEVLPKYFKQSKFTSFTRKLNRWGFTRVTRGPETGAYYHKFFQRDEPRLCMQMSCQNVRLQNEQLALEQQALAATTVNPALNPFLLAGGGAAAASMFPSGFTGSSMAALSSTLMQQQLQQLQIEQLQKQQQLQAAELVRRAMATKATAAATQAHLASLTLPTSVTGGQNDNTGNDTSATSNTSTGVAAQDHETLYAQMLAQSKASSMSAQPLMSAIQNSLRAAENVDSPKDSGSESSTKSNVRRASAA